MDSESNIGVSTDINGQLSSVQPIIDDDRGVKSLPHLYSGKGTMLDRAGVDPRNRLILNFKP